MMVSPHVVVIAFPFASHAVKLFRLARALAAEAPAATFSFVSTATSLGKLRNGGALPENLRFVEAADGLPRSNDAGAVVPYLVRVELFMAAAEAGGVREALEASAAAAGARVSCVVANAFMWMSAEAAAAVAAPWVPVWTGGPSALLAHLRADALRADIIGDQDERSGMDVR
uniref:Uncharacterized protein n=1 Tax=Avena sativa TaxID=4498 RepID=A0ACD6A8J1_AVESA